MPRILALLNFVALLLLVVSAVMGYLATAAEPAFTHMYWGVAAALAGLLGHSLTIFFFLGSGRAIKEACRDHQPAWPFIARARALRRTVTARALAACTMLIVQPVLGAAVYSGRMSAGWHHFGFWVTLLVQAWAAGTALKHLGLGNALLNEVAEWGKSRGPAAPVDRSS
jgi:Na+/H+ antiporter NhaC